MFALCVFSISMIKAQNQRFPAKTSFDTDADVADDDTTINVDKFIFFASMPFRINLQMKFLHSWKQSLPGMGIHQIS